MSSGKDTIYALATPTGRSGVAVVRLSGAQAGAAIECLTDQALPPPRRVVLRALYMPQKNEKEKEKEVIDHALVIYFAAPKSFTGEDVAEFHIHGGAAVIDGLLAACAGLPDLRLAEAGEFSRRAFLNGRADLAEIEGLADLVAAETAAQRRQAVRQMGGAMSALYENWRERLLGVLAQAEARLDFPDEALANAVDEAAALKDLLIKIKEISQEMGFHLRDDHRGERLRLGVKIAIIGAPNVGKSTLLNALARRDAAIVSPQAGTTRDVLEVALDLAGWPVVVSDMAGLRDTGDEIEAEGVRRACAAAEAADLRLVMLSADVGEALNRRVLSMSMAMAGADDLVIVNKIDLSGEVYHDYPRADVRMSLASEKKSGLEELLVLLTQRAASLCGANSSPLITRARHREALTESHQALSRAHQAEAPELLAEDLRLALAALGRITGRVGVEDMLDKLFAEFCIGK